MVNPPEPSGPLVRPFWQSRSLEIAGAHAQRPAKSIGPDSAGEGQAHRAPRSSRHGVRVGVAPWIPTAVRHQLELGPTRDRTRADPQGIDVPNHRRGVVGTARTRPLRFYYRPPLSNSSMSGGVDHHIDPHEGRISQDKGKGYRNFDAPRRSPPCFSPGHYFPVGCVGTRVPGVAQPVWRPNPARAGSSTNLWHPHEVEVSENSQGSGSVWGPTAGSPSRNPRRRGMVRGRDPRPRRCHNPSGHWFGHRRYQRWRN
jgi:hypothetical protein